MAVASNRPNMKINIVKEITRVNNNRLLTGVASETFNPESGGRVSTTLGHLWPRGPYALGIGALLLFGKFAP